MDVIIEKSDTGKMFISDKYLSVIIDIDRIRYRDMEIEIEIWRERELYSQ